jgi:hypothetical protein
MSLFDKLEYSYLSEIHKRGVKIVVAAGNNGMELKKGCNFYPACHKYFLHNMIVIGNLHNRDSNYGEIIDYMIDGNRKGFPRMSGTSQSTAIFTGQLFSH